MNAICENCTTVVERSGDRFCRACESSGKGRNRSPYEHPLARLREAAIRLANAESDEEYRRHDWQFKKAAQAYKRAK